MSIFDSFSSFRDTTGGRGRYLNGGEAVLSVHIKTPHLGAPEGGTRLMSGYGIQREEDGSLLIKRDDYFFLGLFL